MTSFIYTNLANIPRARIPTADFLVIAAGKEEVLSIFVRIELQTVRNFSIGQLGDTLPCFSVPQLDESIIRARNKLFAIPREVQCTDTLKLCHHFWLSSKATYLIVAGISS